MRSSTLQSAAILIQLFAVSSLAQDRDLSDLASHLGDQIAAKGHKVVAVTNFSNDKCPMALSGYIVSRLNIALASTNKDFQVVTRERLDEAYHELQLKLSGRFSAATFAKIGQFTGADSIITGEFTIFGSKIEVTAQILDVGTGRIIGGGLASLPKTNDIEGLLGCAYASNVPPPGGDHLPASPSNATGTKIARAATNVSKGVIADNFDFHLVSCHQGGSSLSCDLSITNGGQDKNLSFHFEGTKCYDQAGNTYDVTRTELGNHSSDGYYSPAILLFIAGVPTRARASFNATSPTELIKRLDLAFNADNQNFVVTFRDVGVQ